MYEDMKDFIQRCGSCQRHGNINSRDAMLLAFLRDITEYGVLSPPLAMAPEMLVGVS